MHPAQHYRADIDGLRALAVGSVLLFHAFPSTFPLGYLGVDVFFVLSGYLISGLMARALVEGRFSLTAFYANRVRRIFPALILVMAVCLLFGWFYLLDDELAQLGKHVLGGGAFVANLLLWQESGYFDEEAVRKPLLHLWSLGVEEQFYIVFPLLFGGLWHLTRRVRLAGALTCLVSLLMVASVTSAGETARFYSPFSRAWELGAGVALAMLDLNRPSPQALPMAVRRTWLLAWWLGCLVLLASLTWRATGGFLHHHPAALSVLSTCLVVAAGGRMVSAPLSTAPFVSLGRMSYPVYLWHWPLFAFAHIAVGDLSMPGQLALLMLSLLLGWATTRWVEAPLRFGRRSGVVQGLTGAMLLLMAIGAWLMWQPSALPRPVDSGQARQFDYGAHWQGWLDCDAIQANPMLGGCKRLDAGPSVQPGQLVVLGDSHAGHLASGLKANLHGKGVGVDIMLHAGCLPVLPRDAPRGRDFDCPDQVIEQGLRHIQQSDAVRLVVLVGYHISQVTGHRLHQPPSLSEAEQRRRLQSWQEGMADMLTRLQAAGKTVMVLQDTPELMVDPRACVKRGWPLDADCQADIPLQAVLARNRELDEAFSSLKRRFPKAVFFDLKSGLCDAQQCRAAGQGELWYASRDHLTPDGSTQVVRPLAPILLDALHQTR